MTDQAPAAIPSCSLSPTGLERQGARYARLAPDVFAARRSDLALEVTFAEGYDRDTLAELVAVERECCPFVELRVDDGERRLHVGVDDPANAPALEAVATALGVGSRTS